MQDRVFFFFKFSLLLLFLQSIFAWFLWGPYTAVIVNYIPIVTAFVFYINSKKTFRKEIFCFSNSNTIGVILFIIIQLYVIRELKITSLVLSLSRIITISIVLLLNDQIKTELFRFFTKTFALLLLVSLFWWILFLLHIPLPYTFVENKVGSYYNYYFFLLQETEINLLIPRFQGVFLEPGYLSMISVFLLIANRFDLRRKEVLITLIAIIFSFSLAAFIVLVIILFLFLAFNSKRPLLNVALMIFLTMSIYFIFLNLNNGENVFNIYLLKRLEYNGNGIAGNNRFSEDLSLYFENFMNTGNKFLGMGEQKYNAIAWDAGNAGYKVFILQYGIIGTFLVFLFYVSIVLGKYSKMACFLLIAYVLIFLQAAYALLECELLIFITAIPFLKSIKYKYSANCEKNRNSSNNKKNPPEYLFNS